jgi:hypothetical protein
MEGTGVSILWSPDWKKREQIVKEQVLAGVAAVKPDRVIFPV